MTPEQLDQLLITLNKIGEFEGFNARIQVLEGEEIVVQAKEYNTRKWVTMFTGTYTQAVQFVTQFQA